MISAVLLDLYDTLVTAPWAERDARLSARLGVSSEVLRRGLDATVEDRGTGRFPSLSEDMAAVASACGISPDPGLVSDLIRIETEFLAHEIVVFTDSFATLARLRELDLRTAVVSNCSRFTAGVVERLGLDRLADEIVLSRARSGPGNRTPGSSGTRSPRWGSRRRMRCSSTTAPSSSTEPGASASGHCRSSTPSRSARRRTDPITR